MLYYLLFALYLFTALMILPRIGFIKHSGIGKLNIRLLFVLKVAAGCFMGWAAIYFNKPNDYWGLHHGGLLEYRLLLHHPDEFILNIFKSRYAHGFERMFDTTDSFWNDLRTILVMKLIALCNIFSNCNFYINTLFFNIVGIFGPVALYRIFIDIFPHQSKKIIAGCFLIPSSLLFTSCLHKDLIVFTCLGIFFYCLYFSIFEKGVIKKYLLMAVSLFIIFFLRNFMLIALLPTVVTFLLILNMSRISFIRFGVMYLSILFTAFILIILVTNFNPLEIISNRQHDFLAAEKAASQLPVMSLEPTAKSFGLNFPEAAKRGFLQPSIFTSKGLLPKIWAAELLCCLLIMGFFLLRVKNKLCLRNAMTLMMLFYGLSMFIIIGYTIPNTNTIVRYKSLYLPLVITPLLSCFALKQQKQ